MPKSIYILNGPNLDLLGAREPEIYGLVTLDDIKMLSLTQAGEYGMLVDFRQTNTEGELIQWIHEARDEASAVILNAGALTHTSVALLDALLALEIPVIEVHLSNLWKREKFRHTSYVSPAATGVICGLGAQGYVRAIDALQEILKESAC